MKPVFSIILAAVALATAAPTDVAARPRVDMVLCRREEYDDCTVYKNIEKQQCVNMPSDISDRVRSATFYHADQCTFYTDTGCQGRSITDAGELPDLRKKFRDKLSSYMCE